MLDVATELDAPPATKINVASTPTNGKIDSSLFTNEGIALPTPRPINKGSNTKLETDSSTPIPSTTTMQFKKYLTSNGIATTPSNVVDKVHATDRATFPPANNANRLLACPPETHPSNTKPAL
mmetsp:Transcript_13258/g.28914  ORF Transcript_13258/g.28914 Transcript_13258/m.28914 type:complete len:123 (+) Transcript_13258:226-594(+)